MTEGGCDPVGTPQWISLLAGPVEIEELTSKQVPWQNFSPCGRPTLQQSVPEGLACHGKGPTLDQFMKSCTLWERLVLEKFMENIISL